MQVNKPRQSVRVPLQNTVARSRPPSPARPSRARALIQIYARAGPPSDAAISASALAPQAASAIHVIVCDPTDIHVGVVVFALHRRKEPFMQIDLKFVGISIAVFCLGTSVALCANGTWSFGTEDRGHPVLSYAENGKTIFQVGCGHAFGLHAVYPGPRKKEGEKARITIDNGKSRMNFTGEISESFEDDPPDTTHFVQWDLGYKRQDPGLYEKKWKLREHRLLDFLDSGRPLKVSAAGGRSYVLPPVEARGWKLRFEQIC